MEFHDRDPAGLKLGITFGIWFLVLLYFLINGIWLGVAAAVAIGIVIVLIALSVSKGRAGIR